MFKKVVKEVVKEVISAVKKYIHFYNNERFQSKLNNLTPIEYRNQVA
ncbi:IS3 family transposase [Brassicibacter mesophilus]